jgi:hypothetical protein
MATSGMPTAIARGRAGPIRDIAADMTAMLPELAAAVRAATPENRRPIVEALVGHPGCGVILHGDGRIAVSGLLAVPATKESAAAWSRNEFGSARILPFRRGAA